jgi:hypothetical protein
VAAILLLYLVFRSGGEAPPAAPVQADNMETVPADRSATYAQPVQPTIVAARSVPVAAAPAADVSQLRLVGLLSRGAVIAMADGSQRFVPVGREILPGVVLRGIDVHHALLATPSGEVRLGFDSAATQPQAAAASTPPTVRSGTPPTP